MHVVSGATEKLTFNGVEIGPAATTGTLTVVTTYSPWPTAFGAIASREPAGPLARPGHELIERRNHPARYGAWVLSVEADDE